MGEARRRGTYEQRVRQAVEIRGCSKYSPLHSGPDFNMDIRRLPPGIAAAIALLLAGQGPRKPTIFG